MIKQSFTDKRKSEGIRPDISILTVSNELNTRQIQCGEVKHTWLFKSIFGILFLVILLCGNSNLFAQTSAREKKADQFFETFSYHEAISAYLRVRDLSLQGQRRLAESYRRTGQFVQSERVYESIVNNDDVIAEDIFNYSSVLRSNGKYAESVLWMERFHQMDPDDLRGRSFMTNTHDMQNLLRDDGQYSIIHLDINGPYQEFGTSYYDNKIVFASTRKPVKLTRRYYNYNDQPFLDLYQADMDGANLLNPRPFFGNRISNNRWHEGPASFARNGELMAFTRSSYNTTSSDGTVKLEVYFSEINRDDSWSTPFPFKLNNPEYSVSHPFLTQDGNTMYFSSDMPGGKGGADLYRIRRTSNGTWGQPENLGETINTEGDELFPFFHESENILIFSSNGHLGLGGLDIFLAPQMVDGTFSYPKNAGARLNTRFDDFALIMDHNFKTGYFSSNREGGVGDDDIYFVEFLKPFIFGKIISGIARDTNEEPLRGVEVELFSEDGEMIQRTTTTESGRFEFVVNGEQEWTMKGVKSGYFDTEISFATNSLQDLFIEEMILEKDPQISLHFAIRDKGSNRPVVNARIELVDKITGEKHEFFTNVAGEYNMPLPDKRINHYVTYEYKVEATGYMTFNGTYNRTLDKEGQYNIFEELGLTFLRIEPGKTRLEELVSINRIEFETYRHTLNVETIAELEKVIEVLNGNPTMAIEIGSHTDCRGSTQLNQQLSERRAQAMAEYIRSRITDPRRVTHKGYGRSVLLNECDCFLIAPQFCTEEQHAENRRTEFIIIRM
jgi:outer membrane protein OmpA-like peptidoglycan-associated protein